MNQVVIRCSVVTNHVRWANYPAVANFR